MTIERSGKAGDVHTYMSHSAASELVLEIHPNNSLKKHLRCDINSKILIQYVARKRDALWGEEDEEH